jgi:hypothetical protein
MKLISTSFPKLDENSTCNLVRMQTKRPPGNRAAFSFQGRIVPTEAKNSVKTFWTKSYGPKKEGVKQFLVNKCLYFQLVTDSINMWEEWLKMRQKPPGKS